METDVERFARDVFLQRIPFNTLLGLELESIDAHAVKLRFAMRDDLVGNFHHGTLHGGVIASVLDATGGLMAFMGVLSRHGGDSLNQNFD